MGPRLGAGQLKVFWLGLIDRSSYLRLGLHLRPNHAMNCLCTISSTASGVQASDSRRHVRLQNLTCLSVKRENCAQSSVILRTKTISLSIRITCSKREKIGRHTAIFDQNLSHLLKKHVLYLTRLTNRLKYCNLVRLGSGNHCIFVAE